MDLPTHHQEASIISELFSRNSTVIKQIYYVYYVMHQE